MRLLAALCVAVAAGAAALVVSGFGRLGARVLGSGRHGGEPAARSARGPRLSREQWLRQAGVDLSVAQLWAVSSTVGLATFGGFVLVTRAPLVALPPAAAMGAVPFVYCGHRRVLNLRSWQAAWPDALRELVAAIVSGRSLGQAISTLGESGPDPLRPVFADFPQLARVLGTAGALEQVKERFADPTSDRVIEVLLVAHERGGSIVRDVLEDLVVATTKDVKVLEEIDTEGLEMRINARAVLVLPWLVLVALTARAGPFRDFYRGSAGLLVVGGAGLLSVVGALWLGRLGRQPAEPRVFAAPGGRSEAGEGGRGR